MPELTDTSRRFTMSVRHHEDVVVAKASGDLDYHHAGLFQERIAEARDALAPRGVVLDLGAVTFCDSMGIGVLVLLLNQGREQGIRLVLTRLPAHLERVLTLTGLRVAFRVEPSVDDAVRAVSGGRTSDGHKGDGP
ncbi:STAS domain-containing protein [Microbispora sp. RL4-1S]|uniref:Anti-sigma factor antagonist n=1 Tax=Microbispora oryzae TaxID=2806554 RepID=A0A940WPG0_9ACTN|nr:STAS domain-containing protein [Microbispora oryzae]MBP2708653.1 STAS domain-containing protein [Microbispora oryzae]